LEIVEQVEILLQLLQLLSVDYVEQWSSMGVFADYGIINE
jgi:hypothetical protein